MWELTKNRQGNYNLFINSIKHPSFNKNPTDELFRTLQYETTVTLISNIPILLFSRSAKIEATRKKIFLSPKKNKKATASLINHSLELLHKSGLTWYTSNENEQESEDFGENIIVAIQSVFAKGHKKVIVIGNDCPDLTIKDLQNSAKQLENCDLILGPNTKGGVYLIGLSEHAFNANKFKNISWRTALVFDQLLAIAEQANFNYHCLNTLSDINKEIDIAVLEKKSTCRTNIAGVLIKILTAQFFQFYAVIEKVFCSIRKLGCIQHRGPPGSTHLIVQMLFLPIKKTHEQNIPTCNNHSSFNIYKSAIRF